VPWCNIIYFDLQLAVGGYSSLVLYVVRVGRWRNASASVTDSGRVLRAVLSRNWLASHGTHEQTKHLRSGSEFLGS
jgi:hypothetical protein